MSLTGPVRDRLEAAGGEAILARLDQLDNRQLPAAPPDAPPRPPDRSAHVDFDVVMAGGGLSLLMAPLLARHGLRVAVFERHRAGGVHREWNASGPELQPLVQSGLLGAAELDRLVLNRYDHGVCRWHGGGSYPVRGVLDHAVDATGLLQLTRERAEADGVTIYDGHVLCGEAVGKHGVSLQVSSHGEPARSISARLLVDARGASSPYASADLVCPTVGGVMADLTEGEAADEMQPDVGEILATTEHVDAGRQHIWEAFPGRPGETTVYLFYYARASTVGPGALAALYERFFTHLARFKRGPARLIRPTFGYIPGWSRLCAAPKSPGRRCVLVGDAAARHSPLTYCGFGNMLRSFVPAANGIARFLHDGDGRGLVPPDRPIHAGTGALSMIMSVPSPDPARADELNGLLDAAFGTLHAMGNETYAALMRDEMPPRQFVDFLRKTSAKRPQVYRDVFGLLGPWKVGRWGVNLLGAALVSRDSGRAPERARGHTP